MLGRPWRAREFSFGLLEDYAITDDTKYLARDYINALLACPAGQFNLEVEIARRYRTVDPPLVNGLNPRVVIPEPRPWPPRDQMSSREALQITIPGEPYGDEIALTTCMEELEVVFDTLPATPHAAWLAVWDFLDGLGWDDDDNAIELPFSAELLRVALDALEDVRCQRIGAAIRDAQLPAGATVKIKRYWGW